MVQFSSCIYFSFIIYVVLSSHEILEVGNDFIPFDPFLLYFFLFRVKYWDQVNLTVQRMNEEVHR